MIEHIEYLLSRYDCVVVPGLGAFIAQYESACFDKSCSSILPPRRNIAFNESISHNDGLLATSISRRENVSYNAAMRIISEGVAGIQSAIHDKGTAEIGRIGTLSPNSQGDALLFIPDATGDCNEYAFLRPVKAIPVLEAAALEAPRENLPDKYIKIHRRRPHLREAMKIAASLLLMIALCIPFISDVSTHSSDVNFASMGPSKTAATEAASSTLIDTVPSYLPLAALPEGVGMAVVDTVAKPVAADSYYLIVASLPTEAKAREFIRDNGNPSLGIICTESRARVYAASSPTLAGALSLAKESGIEDRYPGVWVYRKRP